MKARSRVHSCLNESQREQRMGVVIGEGGQKGITGSEGQCKGSAEREEQNEEWV